MSTNTLPAPDPADLATLLADAEGLLLTHPEAAADLAERALQQSPRDPRVQHVAAEAAGMLGKPELSAATLRQLVQQHGELAELQRHDEQAAQTAWIGRYETVDCPLCGSGEATAVWAGNLSRRHLLEGRVAPVRQWVRCSDCELVRVLEPAPRPVPRGEDAADPAPSAAEVHARISAHEEGLTRLRSLGLGLEWTEAGAAGPRLLQLHSGWGDLLAAASWRGFVAKGIEGDATRAAWSRARLDVDVVEADPAAVCGAPGELAETFEVVQWDGDLGLDNDPMATLRALRGLLAPDGLVIVSTSVLDHPIHRVDGPTSPTWSELDRRQWFEKQTLALALIRAGLQPEASWATPGAEGSITVAARRVDTAA